MYSRPAPKTNISRAYYKHLVDSIEHDPLVRHTTMAAGCMLAVVALLLGCIIWFAQSNPGNLIQTTGRVTGISSGKTDTTGAVSTFITFDFTTRNGEEKSVRQITNDGLKYAIDQPIRVGYHPKNPNFARNLQINQPPHISLALWSIPFILMIWLIFVALFRHHKRQQIIWAAAEAANTED